MEERLTVRLVGGGPWGFRLQGGTGSPLTVSKIRRRSRAQHHLLEGDRILTINGVTCDSLNYDQAMAVVDSADNALNIEIIRGGASGKENRDPSATTHQPKELAKDRPTAQAVKTKPMEPASKSSGPAESSGLRSQAPKQHETTSQPITTPTAKAPPSKPAPPPQWAPQIMDFQDTSRTLTSTSRHVTSAVSEVRSVVQETKSFTASSVPLISEVPSLASGTKEYAPEPSSKVQATSLESAALPQLPKMADFASASPAKAPEVTKQPEATFATKQSEINFSSAPIPSQTEVKKPISAPVTEVKPVAPPTLPEYQKPSQMSQFQAKAQPPLPQATPLATPKPQSLAPELADLAPELAALESELAAFESGPVVQGPEQRRKEVSMETTSDGQRYHSKTSETSSWSAGPQHKGSAFQQLEETREVSESADHSSRRVQSVKMETKHEIHSTSQSSAQHQLSPDKGIDALSWRPTSPIFSRPIPSYGTSGGPATTSSPVPPYTVPKVTKDAPAPAVWTPPSSGVPQKKKKVPPPTPPKPDRRGQGGSRPTSAPPRDYDIWEPFSDSELPTKDSGLRGRKSSEFSDLTSYSGAVSDSEDWHHHYTSEDEMGSSSLYTRRKKMFSSSSFYEEPHCIYPTVEEQVELARKIAGSLSNDNNKKSKGANMFFKRVKRSHTWIHEGPDPFSDGGTTDTDLEPTTPDASAGPPIKVSVGPPKLKLILDPRQLQDLVKLRSSGVNVVEHTAVSPDICMDLVRDLNSPRGKGAALFAKRKQKALEWVVDEEKVKQQIAQKTAEVAHLQEEGQLPFGPVSNVVVQNRLKLIKSPWEAALESPIGSCDAAFVELPPVISNVASSIIRAAENKAKIAPVAASYAEPPFALQPDVYKPKAPRGWVGSTTVSHPPTERKESSEPFTSQALATAFGGSRASSGTPRPYSFHDFNTVARSWAPSNLPTRGTSFRHVAPPSYK